jgi:predicted MFS family arabinose efflux permease
MPDNSMTAEPALPRMAWVLAVMVFICRIGAMVKLFMALYLRQTLGFSQESVGWMLSGYGLGLLIGAFCAGGMSDRVPAVRLTKVALIGSVTALLLLAHQEQAEWIALTLFVSGLLDGGLRTLHQRLIMDFCAVACRPAAQSLSRAAVNLGMACAAMSGGVLASSDLHLMFYFGALLMLLASGWFEWACRRWGRGSATVTPSYAGTEQSASAYRDRTYLVFLVGCTLVGLAYEPVYSVLGNYLVEYYGLEMAAVGWQYALNGFLIVVLQVPLTRLSDPWGVRRQLLLGCLLLAAGLLILPSGVGLWRACASTLFWTLGEILFMQAMGVFVMQRAEAGRSGHYFGLYTMFWSAATLLSPAVSGQVYGTLGGQAVWLLCGCLALLAMLMMSRVMIHRPVGVYLSAKKTQQKNRLKTP